MGNYSSGRVNVANASVTVTAVLEIYLPLTAQLSPLYPINFAGSGALATTISHNLTDSRIILQLIGASPNPAPGDVVTAPSQTVDRSGTATGGSTTVLTDTGNVLAADVGRWLQIRPGEVDEEFARVATITGSNDFNLDRTLVVGVSASDAYNVIETQVGTGPVLLPGSPQDFVSAGVAVGDSVSFGNDSVWYDVASVTTKVLTLRNVYQGLTASGQSFTVHNEWTKNLRLPLFRAGNRKTPSLLNRAMGILDRGIVHSYAHLAHSGFQTRAGDGGTTRLLGASVIHEAEVTDSNVTSTIAPATFIHGTKNFTNDEYNGFFLQSQRTAGNLFYQIQRILDTDGAAESLILEEEFLFANTPGPENVNWGVTEFVKIGAGDTYDAWLANATNLILTDDWQMRAPWQLLYVGSQPRRFQANFSCIVPMSLSIPRNLWIAAEVGETALAEAWTYADWVTGDQASARSISLDWQFEIQQNEFFGLHSYSDQALSTFDIMYANLNLHSVN